MAEIVNLRQVRKRKQREEAQALAAGKRLIHGRSKAEKNLTGAESLARTRHLDGHRLDPAEKI